MKAKVTYDGILYPEGELKLAIALSPRPFSSPTAQNKRSQMGLYIGATVSFQDPKQAYEMKGCGFWECVLLCVCIRACARYDVAF